MIRKVTEQDFDFIYGLYMDTHSNPYLLYEQMDKSSFLPIFNELLTAEVLFVFEKEKIAIGMCKLRPSLFRNAHIVYLGSIAIHLSFAGKGEGSKMMEEIKQYIKEKGFLRMELSVAAENKKAIHLYEKAGFKKEGVMKKFTYLKSENRYMDEVFMAYLV